MAGYVGVNGKARKVKSLYVGVNGKARKVKAGYIGVNGKARLFYKAGGGKVVYSHTIQNFVYGAYYPSSTIFNNSLYVCDGYTGSSQALLSGIGLYFTVVSENLTIQKHSYKSALDAFNMSTLTEMAMVSNSNNILCVGGNGANASGSYGRRQFVFAMNKNLTYNVLGHVYGIFVVAANGCRFNDSEDMIFSGGYTSSGESIYTRVYDGSLTIHSVTSTSFGSMCPGMVAIDDKVLVGATNASGALVATTGAICAYAKNTYTKTTTNSSLYTTHNGFCGECGGHMLYAAGVATAKYTGSNDVYAYNKDLTRKSVGKVLYSGSYYNGKAVSYNGSCLVYGAASTNTENNKIVEVWNSDLTKQSISTQTTLERKYACGAQIGDYYLIIGGLNNSFVSADVYIQE